MPDELTEERGMDESASIQPNPYVLLEEYQPDSLWQSAYPAMAIISLFAAFFSLVFMFIHPIGWLLLWPTEPLAIRSGGAVRSDSILTAI